MSKLFFFAFILLKAVFVTQLQLGQCKTLERKGMWRSPSQVEEMSEGRKIENFVDFTAEGDQLAVESLDKEESSPGGGKRKILGDKKREDSALAVVARQCPNVNKVLYPIVPVIIASLIGLIGAIIISWIARGIFRIIHASHDQDMDDGYGYGRRRSFSNIFGFDLGKVDYLGLTKRVLSAIDKIY